MSGRLETLKEPTRGFNPFVIGAGGDSRENVSRGGLDAEVGNKNRLRFQYTVLHAVGGFVFGWGIRHPLAMVICDWFNLCGQSGVVEKALINPLGLYDPDVVAGAWVFAIFSSGIGAVGGFSRAVVRNQRDDLALQLEVNEANCRELERTCVELRDMEASKRRLTQFLVHDLKNYVGCITGYTRMLISRAEPFEWQRRDSSVILTINRQAERMQAAVSEVLEIARLEQRPSLEPQLVRVIDVLERGLSAIALAPGEETVRIDRTVALSLQVKCEVALIARVVANLAINAIRHNPAGTEVRIGARQNNGSVEFTCSDTGDGIPEEIRDRLFESFSSVSRRDETIPSYGLGLSFCRSAVEAHGGRIWIERESENGTTFTFSIPQPQEMGRGVDQQETN